MSHKGTFRAQNKTSQKEEYWSEPMARDCPASAGRQQWRGKNEMELQQRQALSNTEEADLLQRFFYITKGQKKSSQRISGGPIVPASADRVALAIFCLLIILWLLHYSWKASRRFLWLDNIKKARPNALRNFLKREMVFSFASGLSFFREGRHNGRHIFLQQAEMSAFRQESKQVNIDDWKNIVSNLARGKTLARFDRVLNLLQNERIWKCDFCDYCNLVTSRWLNSVLQNIWATDIVFELPFFKNWWPKEACCSAARRQSNSLELKMQENRYMVRELPIFLLDHPETGVPTVPFFELV